MTFADEVGVAEFGICVGDAGPRGAAMQLRLGDGPECVVCADGVLRGRALGSKRSWNDNLRTYLEKIRIAKTG